MRHLTRQLGTRV